MGGILGGILGDDLLGGGESKQVTNPSRLDYLNADIANTIGPYIIASIFPELAGGNTANKSMAVSQAVNKGAAKGAAPGTAQMFGNIGSALSPNAKVRDNALNMAMTLYGKQPAQGAGGGTASATPGLPDYLNSALDIYRIYSAFNPSRGLTMPNSQPTMFA